VRSLLFVPGHDSRKLSKALASGADALILDLEDSVPDAEKPRARGLCAEVVKEQRHQMTLFVRVNALSSSFVRDDLEEIVGSKPHGIMLPKCSGGHDLRQVDSIVSALETREEVEAGSIKVLPIVTETAASLFGIPTYADVPQKRLCGMLWGGEDLAADIGAVSSRRPDGRYAGPFELARSLCLLGATAAQVPAIDAVFTNFRDRLGLEAECTDALRDGFSGKAAIHPDQVEVINQVFTPSAADVERAQRVIAAFAQVPEAGAINLDGTMLDRPHLRTAYCVVMRAKQQQ
jgi:citrate lyase subunit beta / citryl-CoA lyase